MQIEEDHEGQDLKTNQVKLIVPSNVCGAIIGKGGATIKYVLFLQRHRFPYASH
jgi:predicted RNA-binding protein YlqC (UPF0109 family)